MTRWPSGQIKCLLPIDWYKHQYQVQKEKGGHIDTGLAEDECLQIIFKAIFDFRNELNGNQKELFKKYFKKCKPNYRVGVMKLVPKIHKIAAPFNSEAWKKLPSRPIRGAENCPINGYSIALCKMLQEMHLQIKVIFETITLGQWSRTPIIYGCDEYSKLANTIEYSSDSWDQITIISGDFSDAYTASSLLDLQNSIFKLGNCVNWPTEKNRISSETSSTSF